MNTNMIEITCNDRLGKKVRVKCRPDDTIGASFHFVTLYIYIYIYILSLTHSHTHSAARSRRCEEAGGSAGRHAARQDCAQEMVQRVQRPYHISRLRDQSVCPLFTCSQSHSDH